MQEPWFGEQRYEKSLQLILEWILYMQKVGYDLTIYHAKEELFDFIEI